MTKPKIFIGSSVEGLNIAYSVQQNLTHDAEITVWSQGVFELSQTSIESLVNVLEKSDFAIFVFSPDDITKIRKEEHLTVRDNVIFELGMFIGKLGRQRSFIIMPDKPPFHIPTDLLGITAGKYEGNRTDGNYEAATGPACQQIRIQIKKLGLLLNLSVEPNVEKEIPETAENEKIKENDWWNYYYNKKYDKAIELIEKKIDATTDNEEKEDLILWRAYFEYKIDPQKGKNRMLKLLETEPNKILTYRAVSRFLLWEEDLDYALKIIDEGLTKFPTDLGLLSRKSDYLKAIGKSDEALSLLLSLNYEDNDDLAIKIADLYDELEGKTEEAFSIIKKAYIKNPSSKKLTSKLGRIAQDTDRKETALYLFDKLTKKYPEDSEYWGYLGNACNDLDLTNRAMIAYKKANELSENKESWILSNIGNLLKNQGLLSDSRQYFDMALKIEPNSEYCFNRIAGIIKSEEDESSKYSKLLKEGLSIINEPPTVPTPENLVQ